tara:strand:+ start:28 stop:249 length:222 start_codon:yes stop_codon:yes gene_type:complete
MLNVNVVDGLDIRKTVNMRKGKLYNKKHQSIVKDYDNQKSKHLDKLADKILKNDEKADKLKSKIMKGDFLKNF